MNSYIADTMALMLRLEKRRMPQKVKDIFLDGENGKSQIMIPAIVFAEIAYLSEKLKIEIDLIEVRKIHRQSCIYYRISINDINRRASISD